MSNYQAGLATAIRLDSETVFSPQDDAWWKEYQPYACDRYDIGAVQKWRAMNRKLPLCLFSPGENVFHHQPGNIWRLKAPELEAIRMKILDGAGPDSGHPSLIWPSLDPTSTGSAEAEQRVDLITALNIHYSTYGGDCWLYAVWTCQAFWEGLHKAGTRGLFVLEVGSEHGIYFQSTTDESLYYHFDVPNAAWPAWFLVLADLRGDQPKLERIFPTTGYLDELEEDGEHESSLHFFSAFESKMLEQALNNPQRETLQPKIYRQDSNPWYMW